MALSPIKGINNREFRVIVAVAHYPHGDMSRSEICKATELPSMTVHHILKRFEEKGILMPTRKIDRAQLYKLNENHQNVKFYRHLTKI